MENHGRRCSDASEDASIDYDVEFEGQNGNGRGGQNAVRDDASTSSDVRSCSSSEHGKIVHNHSLGILAARLFDERVPFKKKLKWLNRLATVKDDGTVQFEVPADIKPQNLDFGTGVVYTDDSTDQEPIEAADVHGIPPLHIVMLIVGTRGDVQPFVAIGKRLQEDGHRVRLATHANFKDFVLGAGLEFFPLGGDPKILAGYMVKNKGFLPSGPSEIPIQRNQLKEIIYSLLPACKDPDPDTKVPFKPDAIIANPPAYGMLIYWSDSGKNPNIFNDMYFHKFCAMIATGDTNYRLYF